MIELKESENFLRRFKKKRVIKLSKLRQEISVILKVSLPNGRYSVVPSTKQKDKLSEFFLNVYFDC